MIELFMCYNSIKSRSIFFDRLLLSNLHIELKLVDLICDMYTHAADKWRKYCQYGVKHYPINQCIPVQREQYIIMKTLLIGKYIKLLLIYQAFSKSKHWNNLFPIVLRSVNFLFYSHFLYLHPSYNTNNISLNSS